ncbi:hypothetical protein GSY74_04925 [Sulfurovum sp. bin170]|uniref:hypothetical protein n=1 Tax=Sulfurovum sp. bin170 TaxID=2695268 RepID=UPI0013E0E84E|nr:hypothetical protein [Sulfurovum sp. bin170]NEW60619.1 hypothetical protein [Sulfurovum sp. bin170]
MKKTKLLLSCLLMAGLTGEIAMAKDNQIAEGTTIGFEHCMKPGAPIDITYKATKVGLNEVADINVTLTTSIGAGDMVVTIDFDEKLKRESEVYDSMRFSLSDTTNDYKLNFKASSSEDGLYYIRFLAKIENGGSTRMRAMAVPVYVGDGKLKRKGNRVIMKAVGGENISVSKAEETIEVIE